MIVILDYQAGNLKSLANALSRCGFSWTVSADPEAVMKAPLVILPGVGAFSDAVFALKQSGLWEALLARSAQQRPLLGICLGMQLLFEDSSEVPEASLTQDAPPIKGLGLMRGQIRRLAPKDSAFKVPHMGWNQLETAEQVPERFKASAGTYAYFVHSFGLVGAPESTVLFCADHGQQIPALVHQPPHLLGFQFHPEKSGPQGEALLKAAIDYLLAQNGG